MRYVFRKKIQQELDESQHEGQQNSADIISKFLNIFPHFFDAHFRLRTYLDG